MKKRVEEERNERARRRFFTRSAAVEKEKARREKLRQRRPNDHPSKPQTTPNVHRQHRRFFAEFEFSNGRLSERARANERRLAAAKKARREILYIEAALSLFPNYSASSQRILERWAWRKAARSTLLQFYCVEQQQREQRHWAFSARRSALDRDMRLFQERFAIGTVPAVLAIGTWRPAPGHHFRGHRPGLSMRIRRRLARLPLTAVINVPEPYVSLAC